MATQGWVWARAAHRRFDDAVTTADNILEGADRNADVGQGIEALDRAFRYGQWLLETVPGLTLPHGPDWPAVGAFVRRGRDALAHGDERLVAPGLGYSCSIVNGVVRQHGKARNEKAWRSEELPLATLVQAAEALSSWFATI